jgi:hypothetical protein
MSARFAWNWALAEWQRQYNEFREYRVGLAARTKRIAVKQEPPHGIFAYVKRMVGS